jgi:hypothetical protein
MTEIPIRYVRREAAPGSYRIAATTTLDGVEYIVEAESAGLSYAYAKSKKGLLDMIGPALPDQAVPAFTRTGTKRGGRK